MNKLKVMLLQAVLFILFVALAAVDGWAACTSGEYSVGRFFVSTPHCDTYLSEFCNMIPIQSVIQDGEVYYTGCSAGSVKYCNNTNRGYDCHNGRYYGGGSISVSPSLQECWGNICPGVTTTNFCTTRCDNSCSADSAACINGGGTWANTGAPTCDGKSCKLPVCKQADTQWLDSAKAACDALGGENNFAITEVGETCVHSGTCCLASDSIPVGNTCKWRCDSALTQCNGRTGSLFGAVLPDTSVSGEDTTFSYQCFYNCAYSPNPDSTVYLVEGNTVLSGPSDSIPDGIKSETFNSVRTTTGGVYIYDYLSPAASEYIDSIAAMKCVEHLWRCVINNKYVYWYDNQEVPAGCTNIVRVK